MTTMTTLPLRPLTRADLEEMPDDGHRYELIDGVLIVSPGPRLGHQRVVGNLHLSLRAGCPAELQVILAPFAVALADDTEVQPDLIVAPRSQFTEKELPGAPLLAVEVLSPSTRRVDLLLKRDRLQAAGVPSYWLVDPDEPSVTVLELRDGTYVEVARAVGEQECRVEHPYPLTIVPAQLRD
ncbi:MAG: Uma2 family endonuclease [Actinomycetota bacterium]|nr:Uma2 family endonuclease [Actinomycetota bacterium]